MLVPRRVAEHLGVVVGDEVDAFSHEYRAALTGQPFQSADTEPYHVLFEDFTHMKVYRRSLYDVCVLGGRRSMASATSTTGCRSGWSPPPGRTRCRGDVGRLE